MTRTELLEKLAQAFAHEEGFFVTPKQAATRNIKWPTRAQRNLNPGNIRAWRKNGVPYPTRGGFVDFKTWAGGNTNAGLAEGWRILRVLLGQYVDGRYTHGKLPSLNDVLKVYAPAKDGNAPMVYSKHVAMRLSIDAATPLKSLITE